MLIDNKIKTDRNSVTAHLDDPKTFWENVLWTERSNVELFGRQGSRYIWCKRNIEFHKKSIIRNGQEISSIPENPGSERHQSELKHKSKLTTLFWSVLESELVFRFK